MNAEPLKLRLITLGGKRRVEIDGAWPEKMLLDPKVAEKSEGIVVIVFDDVLISVSNGSARYLRMHTKQDGTWLCGLVACKGGDG